MKNLISTHNSRLTKFASWIIRVRTALAVRFQAVLQLGHSLRLSALTGWVRYAHTAPYRKSAFTLAETLIVIGIIGVVAALTLPNLNHATGDKERITKVKKIYSALNEAYDRAQVVYGDAEGWQDYIENHQITAKVYCEQCSPDNILFTERLADFMKVSKEKVNSRGDLTIALSDGVEFFAYIGTIGPSQYYSGTKYIGYLWVDLDGFDKGKNQFGYDLFCFDITDQGIYPEGIDEENIENNLFNSDYTWGHSKWILENDNADYLKADSSGKCNDSDVVLNWTTNTSCH